jgi:hypothetical protein
MHVTSLLSVLPRLQQQALSTKGERFFCDVPDPDLLETGFSGSLRVIQGEEVHVHDWQCWVDVASLLECRLQTPERLENGWLRLWFLPLDTNDSWHHLPVSDPTEKYGMGTPFFELDKLEEPHFQTELREGIEGLNLQPGERILILGAHKGDEIRLLEEVVGPELFAALEVVAVDHCFSAVEVGRQRWREQPQVTWHCMDLHDVVGLGEHNYALVIAVGTLQSPEVRDRELLKWLVKEGSQERNALLIGFPNSRYVQGALKYGAEMKNYATSEGSLLLKELSYYKRFLQQQRYRVRVKGKYYQFVMAYRSLRQGL